MQGAWADSKTGKLNLTPARSLTLPASGPKPLPKRNATYHYLGTSSTGFGPFNSYPYSPAFAYTKK